MTQVAPDSRDPSHPFKVVISAFPMWPLGLGPSLPPRLWVQGCAVQGKRLPPLPCIGVGVCRERPLCT